MTIVLQSITFIGPFVNPLPMHLIITEVTIIDPSVSPFVHAAAVFLVLVEIAYVRITIAPFLTSFTCVTRVY